MFVSGFSTPKTLQCLSNGKTATQYVVISLPTIALDLHSVVVEWDLNQCFPVFCAMFNFRNKILHIFCYNKGNKNTNFRRY